MQVAEAAVLGRAVSAHDMCHIPHQVIHGLHSLGWEQLPGEGPGAGVGPALCVRCVCRCKTRTGAMVVQMSATHLELLVPPGHSSLWKHTEQQLSRADDCLTWCGPHHPTQTVWSCCIWSIMHPYDVVASKSLKEHCCVLGSCCYV